ncbi:hypothetical protein [Streptomyces sp. H39-S7]|uniref:hypothetical protein n=1 Tax=Streptomyces sp. H39-S7 TaxID=3004357 RepID=UPI0022AF02A4|nr:hypothetical protein [Streptomyces sp. H39-S7]MCZ4118372.1 hypothetical protein [Streptomyces sp. H39-S7]
MLRSSGGSPPCPWPTSEAESPVPGDIPRPRTGADTCVHHDVGHDVEQGAGQGAGQGADTGDTGDTEPKGCLFALSQPPLMLFLCVIAGLIGFGALYDIVML